MSNSKGTIGWQSLQEGDVISYNTQGPLTVRRNKPTSHALVFDRVELVQQKGSPLSHFVIYPLVEEEEATASLRNKYPLQEQIAEAIGLPHGKKWVVLIDPTPVNPENLSDRDSAAKHLGNFQTLPSYDQFLDVVGRFESSGRMIEEGPRTRHTMSEWGLYTPVGITRQNSDDDFEAVPVQPQKKKVRPNKNAASSVRGADISLTDAVTAGLIDLDTAKLFQDPQNKRLKHYTRLANIFDLASTNPAAFEKYVSGNQELREDVKLSELETMGIIIHPTVIWGLSEPRDAKKGESAKPVTTLKEAYNLVVHHPEDMKKYNYLGPKMQEHARHQIPAAQNELAERQGAKGKAAENLVSKVKAAYAKLTNDYYKMETTQVIPDQYINDGGKPMWTFGLRQPD